MLRIRSRITGISIHALLAESDLSNTVLFESPICISIHALLAESDASRAVTTSAARYFYPRSPCGERPEAEDSYKDTVTISIHALLAESDNVGTNSAGFNIISIHALLAESDCRYNRRRCS